MIQLIFSLPLVQNLPIQALAVHVVRLSVLSHLPSLPKLALIWRYTDASLSLKGCLQLPMHSAVRSRSSSLPTKIFCSVPYHLQIDAVPLNLWFYYRHYFNSDSHKINQELFIDIIHQQQHIFQLIYQPEHRAPSTDNGTQYYFEKQLTAKAYLAVWISK